MSFLPIPAAYVDSGDGPGQLAIRDQYAQIPGVPIVYHRSLSDEVATLTALQTASGWLRPAPLLGTLDIAPVIHDTVYLDARQGCTAVLNGYRLDFPRQLFTVSMSTPPTSGTRDDLVFLEAWFIRSDTGRTMQYRLRVVSGVDFTTYPSGLEDPQVTAFDEQGVDTLVGYGQRPAQFDAAGDPGLWWSVRAGLLNDPLTDLGLDNQPHRFTWALPIARVRRLNSTTYDAVSNPNGAPTYNTITPSPRPDQGWNDAIDTIYQLVDIRNTASLNPPDERNFHRALADLLMHQLKTNGVGHRVALSLDIADYGTLRLDTAATDIMSIPVNLVHYSHFASDTLSSPPNTAADGIADGWVAYQTGTGAGTYAMTTGQKLIRTGGAAGDAWGVKQTISGVVTKTLTLQVGYSVQAASTGSILTVLVSDPTSHSTLVLQPYTGLSALTVNANQVVHATYALPAWTNGMDVAVYITGANATVTLNYVDIRPDARLLPIMPVTDGTFYPVARPTALGTQGVTFDAGTSTMRDAITGAAVTGTITLVSNNLEYRPTSPPANADIRLVVGLDYAGADGVPDVLALGVDSAWDAGGAVLPIKVGVTSANITTAQLGQTITAGDALTAWAPGAHKGAIATVQLIGNGGGTYTLPATKYGRKVLWPIDCRIPVNTSQTLSSIVQNNDGTITFTLGSGATVATGQHLYVDVVLDMPVIVWNDAGNGISNEAVGSLLATKLTAATTTVTLAAPGVILGIVASLVCSPIIVNGTGESLATSVTTAVNGATVTLTFPAPLSIGDVVQVLVLVRREFFPGSGTTIGYQTSTAAPITIDSATSLLVLTNPVLLSHTKGTGGVDADPDWGVAPFVHDAGLDGRTIALTGQTPVKSVISDLPLVKNRLISTPLGTGRVIRVADFADAGTHIESLPLSATAPHDNILAVLVSASGRRLLLTVTEKRSDALTSISSGATVAVYEPNGRPVGVAEL